MLAHWWRERCRLRTVVYLDAHLDLQYANPERIRRLAQCRSAEELTALEKPHDLWPDRRFSYSLEDFLYPASRLGLVGRLIWVAPPHVRTGYSEKVVDQLRQMDGVGADDLMSFRRVDGRIEGRLLGLDLTVCELGQLDGVTLPADSLVDIDVDYFVAVPGDHAWIDPKQAFAVLRRLPQEGQYVTISRSVGSGFTPLKHRFLGDYLAALFEDRAEDIVHYSRLFELERELSSGHRDSAVAALGAEVSRRPDCPAAWHLLGLAQREPAAAERCHARAASLSSAYRPGVLREACEIRHRRLRADLARVTRLERQLADVPEAEQALACAAIGLLWCGFGELGRALACYRRASASLGSQSELALQIGKLFLRTGKADEATTFLTAALEDDKARGAAHAYLAQIFVRSGRLAEARMHLEQAHRAAPCWREPLAALADVYRALGEHPLAQTCAARLAEEHARQKSLGRRLAAET